MYQITLKIDGMACSMCESHVCDTIRNQFKVALDPTGYKLLGYACEPYEKKGGLFSIFKK